MAAKFMTIAPIAMSFVALVIATMSYLRDLPSEEFRRVQDAQMKRVAAQSYTVLRNYATLTAYKENAEKGAKGDKGEIVATVWRSLGDLMHRDLQEEATLLSRALSQAVRLGLTEELLGTSEQSLADFYSFKAALRQIPKSIVDISDNRTLGDASTEHLFRRGIHRIVCICATDKRRLFPDERQVAWLNQLFAHYEIVFPSRRQGVLETSRAKCGRITSAELRSDEYEFDRTANLDTVVLTE